MKKNKIYLPIFLAIAAAIGVFVGSNLNYQKRTALFFGSSPQEKKIKKLMDIIEYQYVDEVNVDSLLDGTIKNIVSKLDPHSVYIPIEEHKSIEEKMNGKFVGVGIQFRMLNDTLIVLNTIKGGPSEKAGLRAGDRILVANKDTVFGKNFTNDSIVRKLKGKKNSVVNLTVYRKSQNSISSFKVIRDDVLLKSIDAAYLIKDDIGYIKLRSFVATSYDEFHKELLKLKSKGMQVLILDLRGNSGGFIGVTTKIIDEFLSDKKLIVFTKDNKGEVNNIYATYKGKFEDGKIYVLIDEETASASEILAGALQDNDKGIIVGRRSFGKGLVQQDMDLGDGSSIRLTTARYYTPTGRSIQKPYKLNHKNEYYQDDYQTRYLRGELTSRDSIKVIDSLKYTTPKGRIVYGGGGIIPDIFVPIDTKRMFSNFHFDKMGEFVFNYVDGNRSDFEQMSISSFIDNFDSNYEITNQYLENAKKSFHYKPKHDEQISFYLKAMFARELFDENGFHQMLNTEDIVVNKVLALEEERNQKVEAKNYNSY